MTFGRLFADREFYDVDDSGRQLPWRFHELVRFAELASESGPFDPMERDSKLWSSAISTMRRKAKSGTGSRILDLPRVTRAIACLESTGPR
jgi:hypothetical protein